MHIKMKMKEKHKIMTELQLKHFNNKTNLISGHTQGVSEEVVHFKKRISRTSPYSMNPLVQ